MWLAFACLRRACQQSRGRRAEPVDGLLSGIEDNTIRRLLDSTRPSANATGQLRGGHHTSAICTSPPRQGLAEQSPQGALLPPDPCNPVALAPIPLLVNVVLVNEMLQNTCIPMCYKERFVGAGSISCRRHAGKPSQPDAVPVPESRDLCPRGLCIVVCVQLS